MSKEEIRDTHTLHRTPLPRTFALFFNQNEQPLFRDSAVRKALNTALDRERIVREVLGGYGVPIDGPIPPGFTDAPTYAATSSSQLLRLDVARDILRASGWTPNETTGLWEKKDGTKVLELQFSIETANTDTFVATAEILKATWQELGIPVDIKKFEQSDLTQSVIRPRKYSALLFGTAVGRELDFYSFWHSSQRNDPGLNVALYANITTDAVLADARGNVTSDERKASYQRFTEEMRSDLPALFLFVPEFTYILPTRIERVSFNGLAQASERFSTIGEWYINTESVWPFFTNTTH
jgi:peptide/nickel transport system substrate-binding protein